MKILRGNSKRYRARLTGVALLAALGLIAAGCGGSSMSSAPKSGVAGAQHTVLQAGSSAVVKSRKIKGLGTVLVNAKGRTLYVFAKDKHSKVTCTGSCAQVWPPLKSSGKPKAGGSVKGKLLGLDMDPAGGEVATYNKWPLYTYTGDSAAGQANGQNLNLNGGKWYVITTKGKLVKHS